MKRQSRASRRNGIGLRLQPRDVELLRAVARLRVARTSDLAVLCFGGVRRDTAKSRLRVLFDGGYLNVSSPDQAVENLYSLGPRGRVLMTDLGEPAAAVPRGGLAHHLGIVGTWVALSSIGIPGLGLELARADWELRSEFGKQGLAVVPDLFAVLSVGPARLALAVEVDLGTEPLRVLRAKVRAYDRLLRAEHGLFGWPDFVLAAALVDDRRRESVEKLLRREWIGARAIWTLGEGPGSALKSLLVQEVHPLTASPRGKGRIGVVSPDTTDKSGERRGGHSDE